MGGLLNAFLNKTVTIQLDKNTLDLAARSLVMSLAKQGVRIEMPAAQSVIIEVLMAINKEA